MSPSRRKRWGAPALLVCLALVAGGCGGGGGDERSSGTADDPVGAAADPGERPVQVTGAGKVRLAGTLFIPAAESGAQSQLPGVLLVPTLGPGDRNSVLPLAGTVPDPVGKDLAEAFAGAGLATYRYDRRGTGESKLEPDVRLSFEDQVADARAGLDLLAQRKETAGTDLAVVGYDQGGLVALRLAATDPRVKRVVLISTPGRPLVEAQAAALSEQLGPESGEALKAAVTQMMASRSLPPPAELRTELRTLLTAEEIPYLVELYGIDPVAEAAKVKVPALVVSSADRRLVAALAPERLAQAMGRAELVLVDRVGPTLDIAAPPPEQDPGDPSSSAHIHGAAGGQAPSTRDTEALTRISSWLASRASTSAAPR